MRYGKFVVDFAKYGNLHTDRLILIVSKGAAANCRTFAVGLVLILLKVGLCGSLNQNFCDNFCLIRSWNGKASDKLRVVLRATT